MRHEVRVPDIGEFDEVEIVEVLVAPGDSVEADQSLVTLESDKASMDIPAPMAGTIVEVEVGIGDMVGEGSLIVTLEAAGAPADTAATRETVEAAAPSPEGAAASDTEAVKAPQVEPRAAESRRSASLLVTQPAPRDLGGELPHASPSVRRLARELGADLTRVRGSGRKGRILQDDVKAFVKTALSVAAAGAAAPVVPVVPAIDFSKFGEIEEVALSRIQRRSKENLHRSWLNVPHVTQFDEADITDLEAFRRAHKEEAQAKGFRLSILPFVMQAVVEALREHPRVSSSLHPSGEALILKKYFHLGIAVDTDEGLVVPVVRDVDQKSVYELAEELGEVSGRAREGKLRMQDLQGACFTISSLGGIGGTAFTPIVSAPEVAILGVSRSRWRPVYNPAGDPGAGELVPRLLLPLSLSYDHRVVDGAEAVRFTSFLAGLLADVSRLQL